VTQRGRLIVLCGLPGSGKTTVGCQLEREHGAVRLSPDEWMHALGFDVFDNAARGRVERLQWEIAQRLMSLGDTVVVEWGTWKRAERDTLRRTARAMGCAVELRFLDAPLSELWRRVDARGLESTLAGRQLTFDDLRSYSAMFERPDVAELALFDDPLP
jgi:predicted kinase